MRTSTAICWVSMAISTMAQAAPAPQEEKRALPRYYFPRHIKRQIVTNGTTPATSSAADPLQSVAAGLGLGAPTSSVTPVSTPITRPDAIPVASTPTPAAPSSVAAAATSSAPSGVLASILPVVPAVVSSAVPSTGLLPDVIVPASTPEPAPSSPAPSSAAPSSIAGTGSAPAVVVPASSAPEPASSSAAGGLLPLVSSVLAPSVATPTPTQNPAAVASTGGFPSSIVPASIPIVDPLASAASSVVAPLVAASSTPTADPAAVASTGGLPSSIIPANTPAASTPVVEPLASVASSVLIPLVAASSTPTPDPAAVASTGGIPSSVVPASTPIVDPLASIVSSALGPNAATPTPALVASTGGIPSSVVPAASAPEVTPVSSAAPASPTGLLVGLSTILSNSDPLSILPAPTNTPATAPAPVSSGISGAGTGTGLLPSLTDVVPALSSVLPTVAPVLSSAVSGVSGAGTGSAPLPTGTSLPLTSASGASGLLPVPTTTGEVSSTGVPSGVLPPSSVVPSGSVSVPSGSGVPSGSVVTPTDLTSATPTDYVSTPISAASTTPTLAAPTQGSNTTLPTVEVSSAPEAPSSSIAMVTTSSAAPPQTVASLLPTATDTLTSMTQPSQILVQPSATGSQSTASSATGIPTSMPKVIAPPGPKTEKPTNTTLCQIGFTHELNYGFVSSNPSSAGQIFQFLPQGTGYGLSVSTDQIKMFNIQPYDTSKQLGYITTLALIYIPSDQVNQLGLDLHTPNSPIYHHPDLTVRTLMSFINPSIPLIAGQPMDGSNPIVNNPGGTQNQATSTAGSVGGANPFGSDASNSAPAKASAAGIAGAVVGGVALYGAAMALVARRYRNKKKNAHRRNSSMTDPAWMSGADGDRNSRGSNGTGGRSIQTTQISAPLRTENSLGWN